MDSLRSYNCSRCGLSFNTEDELKEHSRSMFDMALINKVRY